MLSSADREAASELLWRTWQAGEVIPDIPEAIRPRTRADGYAVQALIERRTASPLFGWKIAATSKAGQAHINVDGPLAGRILAERVVAIGMELDLAANRMRVAEPEFAFRMGRDLAPRAAEYGVDEALAAVATLHPAIEIPDSRFADFTRAGAAQLIADNACAHQFTLGPAVNESWRSVDLAAHPVTIAVVGGAKNHGSGANVLGDPRAALAWLANELSRLGITLRAGQVVTTGTSATPMPLAPGNAVVADFSAFGTIGLRFAAARS